MSHSYSHAFSEAFDTQQTGLGGYDGLLSIYKEAEQEYASRRASTPTACPNDGTALKAGPRGVLFCPFDGVQWPRDRSLFTGSNHP